MNGQRIGTLMIVLGIIVGICTFFVQHTHTFRRSTPDTASVPFALPIHPTPNYFPPPSQEWNRGVCNEIGPTIQHTFNEVKPQYISNFSLPEPGARYFIGILPLINTLTEITLTDEQGKIVYLSNFRNNHIRIIIDSDTIFIPDCRKRNILAGVEGVLIEVTDGLTSKTFNARHDQVFQGIDKIALGINGPKHTGTYNPVRGKTSEVLICIEP